MEKDTTKLKKTAVEISSETTYSVICGDTTLRIDENKDLTLEIKGNGYALWTYSRQQAYDLYLALKIVFGGKLI